MLSGAGSIMPPSRKNRTTESTRWYLEPPPSSETFRIIPKEDLISYLNSQSFLKLLPVYTSLKERACYLRLTAISV